jgi:hypothetical protein
MEFITIGDRLLIVYRRVKERRINGGVEGIEAVRVMWHCDAVLRHGDMFIFCKEVSDVEIVTE